MAVAKPDRDAGLTPEARQHMAAIRATRALTVAITNEAWGTALTPQMRHAVAEYMRRHRLDVSEVDILGGKIYRNGYYYRRRIAEMRAKSAVEWTEGEHIGPDKRLDTLASSSEPDLAEQRTWAIREQFRRLQERIRWAVPEDATHAYVVRVKLRADQKVLEGCDWITPLRTKKGKFGEKVADPIGAEEPEKTVITRAWRRCGLLVAAEVPELRAEEAAMTADAEVVDAQVEQIATTEEAREAELSQPAPQMALPAPMDPYGPVVTAARAPEPAGTGERKEPGKQSSAFVGYPELAASINRLLKHERVSEADRARLTIGASNAETTADLELVMQQLEGIITGDGELGL